MSREGNVRFIPMKSVFVSTGGGRDTDYVSVLPKTLTLDASYVGGRWLANRCTLFKEAKMERFCFAVPHYVYDLFDLKVSSRKHTVEELLANIIQGLESAILETWKPGGVHVVMHSSGLDSRTISFLIKRLHRRMGDDWLGQILFLCSKWEAPVFKEIMKYEGWKSDQYAVPYEELDKPEYYRSSLSDFENAWRWNNGASAIPVNLFWYPVQWALDTGRLDVVPDQMYTGQWGNTIGQLEDKPGVTRVDALKSILVKFYYSILCSRPMYAYEVVHPFTNVQIAEDIVTSYVRLGLSLRPALVYYLDARLSEFTNMMADGDRHNRIDDGLVSHMISCYDNSWYGRVVHRGLRPAWKTTEFQDFWYHWSAASLCEHLRKNGYRINVKI